MWSHSCESDVTLGAKDSNELDLDALSVCAGKTSMLTLSMHMLFPLCLESKSLKSEHRIAVIAVNKITFCGKVERSDGDLTLITRRL